MAKRPLMQVAAMLFVLVSVSVPAGRAEATVRGLCGVSIQGQPVEEGRDSPAEAVHVSTRQPITLEGTFGSESRRAVASSLRLIVRVAGIPVRLWREEALSEDRGSWLLETDASSIAWASVGLAPVRIEADTSEGVCLAEAYVCLGGRSPLTTLLGGIGLLAGLLGLALLVGLLRSIARRSRRSAALRALLGQGLLSFSVGVFLQQTCVGPLDGWSVGAVPLFTGAVAALLFAAFAGRSGGQEKAA